MKNKILRKASITVLLLIASIPLSTNSITNAVVENKKIIDGDTVECIKSKNEEAEKVFEEKVNKIKNVKKIDSYLSFRGSGQSWISDTEEDPYSGVCYIESFFPNGDVVGGTAFLLYSDMVITAAHCAYNEDKGGWADNIYVAPGCNGPDKSDKPYGVYRASRITVNSEYRNDPDEGPDYSIVTLNKSVNSDCYIFGKTSSDDYLDEDYKLYIAGFPDPMGNQRRMYRVSGYADSYDSDTIEYDMDIEEGFSGGPIYIKKSSGKYRAIGVHSRHYDEDDGLGIGVRFTDEILDYIRNKHYN